MGEAPAWFTRALAVPSTDGHVEVAEATIHYLAWGEPGRRGLVFVQVVQGQIGDRQLDEL